MKIKKVELKKLKKLLKKNEKAIKELTQLLENQNNQSVKEIPVAVEVPKETTKPEFANGVVLEKENWNEYLNLLTSNFKPNEDGSISIDILLDTSASTNIDVIRKFLFACKDMMKYHNVRVGCFDTDFYGFHTLKDELDILRLELKGGGGTYYETAIAAFDENVPNRIIFTDGYASMPEDSKGAYWIVTGNSSIYPNNGTVIYLDENIIENDNSIFFRK